MQAPVVTQKMDPELKGKWVEALRGGDYKQGLGQLRASTNSASYYCCLGVFCEIAGIDYSGAGEFIPEESPIQLDEVVQKYLALMNDGSTEYKLPSLSFPQIADWIEANL